MQLPCYGQFQFHIFYLQLPYKVWGNMIGILVFITFVLVPFRNLKNIKSPIGVQYTSNLKYSIVCFDKDGNHFSFA